MNDRVSVDKLRMVVTVDDREVYLSVQTYRAFLALWEAEGAVVAHRVLLAAARGVEEDSWLGSSDYAVAQIASGFVHRIHRSLGDAVNIMVRRGVGYQLRRA